MKGILEGNKSSSQKLFGKWAKFTPLLKMYFRNFLIKLNQQHGYFDNISLLHSQIQNTIKYFHLYHWIGETTTKQLSNSLHFTVNVIIKPHKNRKQYLDAYRWENKSNSSIVLLCTVNGMLPIWATSKNVLNLCIQI